MADFDELLSVDPSLEVEDTNQDPDPDSDPDVDIDADPDADGDGGDDADPDNVGDDDADDADGDPDAEGDKDPDADADAEAAKAALAGDARTLPAAVKSHIKELQKTNPELAKAIRETFFTKAAYGKFGSAKDIAKKLETLDSFGSPEDLTTFKEKYESLGGAAGLDESLTNLGVWQDFGQKWFSKDPAAVDQILKESPEAFAAMMPTAISRFASSDPQAYSHIAAGIVKDTLVSWGLVNDVSLLGQALDMSNVQLAAESFTRIQKAVQNLQAIASKAPAAKPPTGAADPKVQTELQTIATQKEQLFNQQVGTTLQSWLPSSTEKEFSTYLKGQKISPGMRSVMFPAVQKRVSELLSQNTSLKMQMVQARKRGDVAAVNALYKKWIPKVLPEAVRKTAREFDMKIPAKAAKVDNAASRNNNQGANKPAAGWKTVNKYPDPKSVNYDLTTDDMQDKDQYILKNGSKVQVKFNS